MKPDTTTAYRGHNGLIVATCECGWWTEATPERGALVALREHQDAAHRPSEHHERTEETT